MQLMTLQIRLAVSLCFLFVPCFFGPVSDDAIIPISLAGLDIGGIEESFKGFGHHQSTAVGQMFGVNFESSTHVPGLDEKNNLSFKVVRLKNGVEAILYSNPANQKTEISLVNQVGYRYDPKGLHGLGFYLMNVMVSASKRDPGRGLADFIEENSLILDYQPFLSHSEFFIITTQSLFEKTLDLVSEMFTSPVITKEVMERALDRAEMFYPSETMLNYYTLSSPDNPFSRYKYGDRKTLKLIPERNNIDMRQKLEDFFNEYYSSNRMIITIKSGIAMNTLKELVMKYFSDIPNKYLKVADPYAPSDSVSINPLSYSIGKVLCSYRHEDTNKSLKLLFPLKSFMLPHMRSDPTFYIKQLICDNRSGSLFNYLNKKQLVSNMLCEIINHSHGFTNIQITFHLSDYGTLNIHNIVRSFFFALEKIKELNLDLDYYKIAKQQTISELRSSVNHFNQLSSSMLMNNYFRQKGSDFDSLIFGLDKFSDFDVNLHKHILSEMNPGNMILMFNYIGASLTIKDTQAFRLFDQSVKNEDCPSYYKFLSEQTSFNYVTLMNILSSEFVGVEKSLHAYKYILEDINFCLKKYFTTFSESLSQELKIINLNSKNLESSASLVAYLEVMKQIAPVEFRYIIHPESRQQLKNFYYYRNFYYFIPHALQTPKVYIALNFSLPFKDSRVGNVSTTRIIAILFLLKEALYYYGKSLIADFKDQKAEFTPEIYLPSDSVINVFGVSVVMASTPNVFSTYISNFCANLKKYTNMDSEIFKQFLEAYKKKLSKSVETQSFKQLYLDFVLQLNTNREISGSSIHGELQTLTVAEYNQVLEAIFKKENASGLVYGNSSPLSSCFYLERLFSEFFEVQQPVSRSYSLAISIKSTSLKRGLTRVGLTKKTNQRLHLTKKKTLVGRTRKMLTLRRSSTRNVEDEIDSEISSRNMLYKSYSSRTIGRTSSSLCKDMKIVDMSSVPSCLKFFIHKSSEEMNQNISVVWIHIDKASPDSLALIELLNFMINHYLGTRSVSVNDIELKVVSHRISRTSCFISLEGRSEASKVDELNNFLSDYAINLFNYNSPFLDESLFNLAKTHFANNEFSCGAAKDFSILNIFSEITNRTYDFNKFRSIVKLINKLSYDRFLSIMDKVHREKYILILTITPKDFFPSVPKGYIKVKRITDVAQVSGIRVFRPEDSRHYQKYCHSRGISKVFH